MEITCFPVFLTLIFVLTFYHSNTFGQEGYTQLGLPEGAKMRLGKGSARTIEYSPDGTFLAVASDIGIWLYDVNSDEELKLFTEHTSIHNISFSPDGKTLASVDSHGIVSLWDVLNGEVKRKFHGSWLWTKDEYDRDGELQYRHEYGSEEKIIDISFSPDGKTLAVVGRYAIYLTETIEWMLIDTDDSESFFGPPPSQFLHSVMYINRSMEGILSFSPDGQTLASENGHVIRLWDILTGTVKQEFVEDTNYVWDISFSPDGKTLASGGSNEILLWDVSTDTIKHKLTRHKEDRFRSVSFSPDGKTLASGADYGICLWDVSTGAVKQVYETRNGSSVSFSPDGKTLASIISYIGENAVCLWDVLSTTCERVLDWHTKSFSSVSFSPDGKTLMGRDSWDYSILWDVSTGTEKQTNYNTHAVSPDSQTLAFCKYNSLRYLIRGISPMNYGTIVLWDMLNNKQEQTLIGHRGQYINNILFSPDGKTLASSDVNYDWHRYTLRLWDVLKGKTKTKRKFTGHSKYIWSLSFSPDSKTLASGDAGGNIFLWDVLNGKVKQQLKGGTKNLLFSPDGKTLASIDSDRTVYLWNVSTGKVGWTFKPKWGWIENISFSPDNRMFAIGNSGEGYTIRLCDINWKGFQHTVEQELIGHTSPVNSVSFSPDGKMLASGSTDGTLLLWDVSDGKVMQKFIGHTSWVNSVSFSPDGKMFASGSQDGTVLLWDIPTR